MYFRLVAADITHRSPSKVKVSSSSTNRRKIKSNNSIDFKDQNSDVYLNSLQLISKYGYTPEVQTVITSDGYLVKSYRIPNSGPPVLLVHGIGDSSDSWLVLGPSRSVAFQLSDLGYDVWIYNARGNKYSQGHVKNLNQKQYWNFSNEEMGTEDLPALIDHILLTTSQKRLSYIGFSQGTTNFLIMCSMRPEYNEKIKKAILLAPVAWISNIKYPFMDVFASNINLLYSFFNGIGVYNLFSDNVFLNLYHAKVCQDGVTGQILCALEFYIAYGIKNIKNLYPEKLPVLASHIPAGISTKTFVHFFQTYLSKRFQRYDYGSKANQLIYSSPVPPNYNLSLVTAPLYIFYSDSDWFSTTVDVKNLLSKLPNVVKYVNFNESLDFTHLEFIYGARINSFINDKIKMILDNRL
ncbi:unnamed protein product [Arctia plantaginis]|uniref:Lipase n=1 Tax=Arctia plantaginis TaxID=874455 RepID=A0A8S0ZWG8_ARCPL|nr:unnamed protein product [Arctia plantaginis]CAB3238884.1 unnamed protein product [Arctia plantaginis]